MRTKVLAFSVCTVLAFLTSITPAAATHSLGSYHWARTANPFQLQLGDNVNSSWDYYLSRNSALWGYSAVVDTPVVGGGGGATCQATSGRVEVCNGSYGANGWLGIASIWASGSHITSATVKLNDTYFNTPTYNTFAWRHSVMCQEIGHTLGLDHQDENFDNANLGSCMDYGRDPSSNMNPNAHDYQQLETIYSHLDTTTTVGASGATQAQAGHTEKSWGRRIEGSRAEGQSTYERHVGGGKSIITYVTWA